MLNAIYFLVNQKSYELNELSELENIEIVDSSSLTDDVYIIKDSDNKYGFIDTNGNIIIEPEYGAVLPFSEGLAVVFDENGTRCIGCKGGERCWKGQITMMWLRSC